VFIEFEQVIEIRVVLLFRTKNPANRSRFKAPIGLLRSLNVLGSFKSIKNALGSEFQAVTSYGSRVPNCFEV
jgi:hypothetical protein